MFAVSTPATTPAKTARTIAVILQPRWAAVSRVPAAKVAAARMPRITVMTPSPTVPPFPMPDAEMPKGPEAHGRMEPSRMAQIPPYPSSRLPVTLFLPERLRWPRVRHPQVDSSARARRRRVSANVGSGGGYAGVAAGMTCEARLSRAARKATCRASSLADGDEGAAPSEPACRAERWWGSSRAPAGIGRGRSQVSLIGRHVLDDAYPVLAVDLDR